MSMEFTIIETFEKTLGVGFGDLLSFMSVLGGLLFFAAGAREGAMGLFMFSILNLITQIWLGMNYYSALVVAMVSTVIVIVTFIFYKEKTIWR